MFYQEGFILHDSPFAPVYYPDVPPMGPNYNRHPDTDKFGMPKPNHHHSHKGTFDKILYKN